MGEDRAMTCYDKPIYQIRSCMIVHVW